MKAIQLIFILAVAVLKSHAQGKPGRDVTAPLHAIKVDYPTAYEPILTPYIKKT